MLSSAAAQLFEPGNCTQILIGAPPPRRQQPAALCASLALTRKDTCNTYRCVEQRLRKVYDAVVGRI